MEVGREGVQSQAFSYIAEFEPSGAICNRVSKKEKKIHLENIVSSELQ